MTPYGLGIELTPAAVRWASATGVTDIGAVTESAPTVAIVGGQPVAGSRVPLDATPANVVSDITNQFVIDRLWFVGGIMLTPDDALRAVLAGCLADASAANGGPPGAVTLSCPVGWDEEAIGRLRLIVEELGVALPAARTAVAATVAAADAATRLPERTTADIAAADLPPLPPPTTVYAPIAAADAPVAPRPAPRRRRWGLLGWLVVVIGIPAVVFVAVRAGREEGDPDDATTTAGSPRAPRDSSGGTDVSAAVAVAVAAAPLTVGLLSNGDGAVETAVRNAVVTVAGDAAVFPSGYFAVVQPIGADAATAIATMRGQAVTALLSDAVGDQINVVAGAARASGLPVCFIGGPGLEIGSDAVALGLRGAGIALGTPASCVQLLGLAWVAAGTPDPALLVEAMASLVGADGLSCTTVAQCAAYLQAQQPISFEPPGEPIVLAPIS